LWLGSGGLGKQDLSDSLALIFTYLHRSFQIFDIKPILIFTSGADFLETSLRVE
jgi:hypothetical protein